MILKAKLAQYNHLVAANFFLILFGSSLVTLNAKLIGLQYSFFFYLCVLGLLNRLFTRADDHSCLPQRIHRRNSDQNRNRSNNCFCLLVVCSISHCVLFTHTQTDQKIHGFISSVYFLFVLCVLHRVPLSCWNKHSQFEIAASYITE